jgi:hypothetical protein
MGTSIVFQKVIDGSGATIAGSEISSTNITNTHLKSSYPITLPATAQNLDSYDSVVRLSTNVFSSSILVLTSIATPSTPASVSNVGTPTSCDGDGTIKGGNTCTVSWTGSGTLDHYYLEYSINSAKTWFTIADDIAGTSYAWKIPYSISTTGQYLRVTAHDSTDFPLEQATSAGFNIARGSATQTIEQQINMADGTFTTVSTSYIPTTNSIAKYDPTKYTGPTAFLEVVLNTTNASGTASVTLVDSNGQYVPGSELTTTSTTYTRLRTNALNLAAGNYSLLIKNSNSSYTTSLNAARLVIIQSADALKTISCKGVC